MEKRAEEKWDKHQVEFNGDDFLEEQPSGEKKWNWDYGFETHSREQSSNIRGPSLGEHD